MGYQPKDGSQLCKRVSTRGIQSYKQQLPARVDRKPRPDPGLQPSTSRRTIMLSTAAPVALLAQLGTDDPITVINSVLGAYFLPQFADSKDFKKVKKEDYTLEFPKAWVSRPNTGRPGLYVSSFKTSDKMTLEIFDTPEADDPMTYRRLLILNSLQPNTVGSGDLDRFGLPSDNDVKYGTAMQNGLEYEYLRFPSSIITRSGYQVQRTNFAVAVKRRDKVYMLTASATSDQYDKEKESVLVKIINSFEVF